MTVSIVVPMRPDGGARDRNWQWVKARYERLYPEWEIVEHPGNSTGPWSKGAAVNAAVAKAAGDVVIVADADVIVAPHVLPEAVAALDRAPWVVPHKMVYRLTEAATAAVIAATDEPHIARPRSGAIDRKHYGPPGGGLVVAATDAVLEVGGIDERFIGWGGEDISFARALDTIIGPHSRLTHPCWHLDHPPAPRRPGNRASSESERLAGAYLSATGDRQAMQRLCCKDEDPYEGVAGGGLVIAPREVIQSVPPDHRFVGWG